MSESKLRLRFSMELEAVGSSAMFADVARVKGMAEAILAAPVLAAVTKVQVDDKRPKKVTAKNRAEIAATGKDSLIEYVDQADPGRGVFVSFNLEHGGIGLKAIVEPSEIAKHRATALDDLLAAALRAAEIWRGVAVVRDGFIKAEYDCPWWDDPPYARLRNPRSRTLYPRRSLVTFLGRGCADRAKDIERLTQPPPAHAVITTHDDLVVVRWANSLDDDEIARASTRHDCWIRRVETEPERDFNAHGDAKVHTGNAKPRAPLTLYNPWAKTGFKAVLVTPEGELEESAWEDALSVLKANALPDGDEVMKLWIVVPLREHAIAVHERVVAAGFAAAVYPVGNEFWDPVPKGPWLDTSTDNGAQVGAATGSGG